MKRIIRLFLTAGLIWMLLLSMNFLVYAVEYDCASGSHKYVVVEEKAATDSEDRYTVYECELCGDTYTQFTYQIEHQWSEWVTEKQPTCTAQGIRKRTCTVGTPHSETQEVPATGHTYTETRTKPSCTEPGNTTYVCSVCGDSYTETFGEPEGHDYAKEITKEADCEHDGVKTYTCGRCGDSYTEAIPAVGHNYGEWITDKPAGEGIEGLLYRECKYCEERITETIAALLITPGESDEPEEPEEPDNPFFGPVEIAVTAGNAAVWIFLFLILASEFKLLFWIRRRKKKVLAEKNEKEDYGYESL